jgi:DNA topoisomerase-1
VEQVAQSLGNTPTVCRQCDVHPAIIDAYLDGAMVRTARERADERLEAAEVGTGTTEEAKGRHEQEVLRVLRDRLAAAERGGSTAA